MARRDVELVVRAKDEAEKVIKSLTGAVNQFTKAQDGLKAQGGETDSTLSRLGATFKELDSQLKGFTVGQNITRQLDRATSASDRLDKSLTELTKESARLSKETAKVEQENAKLAASTTRAASAVSKQATAVKRAQANQKELTASLRQANAERGKLATAETRTQANLTKQNAAVDAAAAKYQKLSNQVTNTVNPTKRLAQQLATSNTALDRQKAKLETLNGSYSANQAAVQKAETSISRFAKNLAESNANLTKQKTRLDELQREYKETEGSSKAAARQLKNLRGDSEKVEQSLLGQREALNKTQVEMDQLATAAGKADRVLQSLATRSGAALQAAFDKQRRTLLETKREWKAYQAQVATAAASTVKIGPPTRQVAEAMARAQISAGRAKKEYQAQRVALQQLSGVLRQSATDTDSLRARQERFVQIQARTGQAIARIRSQSEQAARSNQVLANAAERAGRGLARVSQGADRVAASTGRAAGNTGRLAGTFNRLNGETRRSLGTLQRVRGQVLSMVAAYGGLFGVVSLIGKTRNAVRELEAAQSRLNVVFDGDQRLVGEELGFIRRESKRLALDFGALAQEYTKFAVATKGTNLEGEKTRQIFLGLATSARVNKLTTAQTGRAFNALTQIASKGVVQMEELRQQLGDSIPGAIQKFAKASGFGADEVDKFFKAVTDGEIGAEKLVDFARVLAEEAGPQLDKALAQNTARIDKFFNSVTFALQRFGAGGLDDGLADLADSVANVLDSDKFRAFSDTASAALGKLLDIISVLAENFDVLIIAMSAFAGVKLAGAVIRLATAFSGRLGPALAGFGANLRGTTAAMRASTGAAGAAAVGVRGLGLAFRAVFSATGIGLAITAITTVLGYLATQSSEVTKSFDEMATQTDKVKAAFRNAEGDLNKFRKALDGLTVSQAQGSLLKAEEALAAIRKEANTFVDFSRGAAYRQAYGGSILDAFTERAGKDAFEAIRTLRTQFVNGAIDAGTFKKGLDEIAQATDADKVKQYAIDLQAVADRALKAEGNIGLAKDTVVALSADTDKASAAMNRLGDSTDQAGQNLSEGLGNTAVKVGDNIIKLTNDITTLISQLQKLDSVQLNNFEQQLTFGPDDARSGLIGNVTRAIADRRAQLSGGNFGGLNAVAGAAPNPSSPEYLANAASLLGLNETSGRAAIQKYLVDGGAGLDPSVTAWCAAFVNATLGKSGIKGTGSNLARSFLNFGSDSSANPAVGDIAVFSRGNDPSKGHVGFFQGFDEQGNVRILGGNQGGKRNGGGGVTESTRSRSSLLGIRRAPDADAATIKKNVAARFKIEQDAREKLEKAAADKKKKQDAVTAGIDAENAQRKFELSIADKGEVDQQVATALREAELKLQKEGLTLTTQQKTEIEATTRALAEKEIAQKKAKDAAKGETEEVKAAKKANEEVNALVKQRKELQEQLKIFQQGGNTEGVERTKEQISALNEKITEAANKARDMWTAIGGSAADAAAAKLETTALKTAQLAKQGTQVAERWKGVDQLFATGLTNAFDSFAQSVAKGENVFDAARNAFLQFASDFLRQIAQMIIQQAILSALGGGGAGGGGGAIGGFFTSLFGAGHTGGLVGSERIGSGNPSRRVSPLVFANAQRFHEGGLPGLRPNEVATILKKNEEVLTENDPRNVLNGGGKGGTATKPQDVKVVNAIDSGSFISAGLDTKSGEKAILNFMRVNSSAIQSALSG